MVCTWSCGKSFSSASDEALRPMVVLEDCDPELQNFALDYYTKNW